MSIGEDILAAADLIAERLAGIDFVLPPWHAEGDVVLHKDGRRVADVGWFGPHGDRLAAFVATVANAAPAQACLPRNLGAMHVERDTQDWPSEELRYLVRGILAGKETAP